MSVQTHKNGRTPLAQLERRPTRDTLEELCERRFTIPEIKEFLHSGESTVEYRLEKFDLETAGYAPKDETLAAKLLEADSLEDLTDDSDPDAGERTQAELTDFAGGAT